MAVDKGLTEIFVHVKQFFLGHFDYIYVYKHTYLIPKF